MFNGQLRFGRRIPLPATSKIKFDLKLFSELETRRVARAVSFGLATTATWDDIAARSGKPPQIDP